jgi:hypothetical protein
VTRDDADEFLGALALLSTAAVTICLTVLVALLAVRSGLGTPPSLLIVCVGIVLSAAYAPFLVPRSQRARLDSARFAYPLLMLAVTFSPVLLLTLPPGLGHLYALTGVAAAVRAAPYVVGSGRRALLAVSVAGVVLGVHLFVAQGLHASAFLPELMALGRFSGDPYLHAAVASMIRYNGVPSTGLDGTVPLGYHVGSHHWFAAIGAITGSDTAHSYLVGRTVFMLPALCLALFVAALGLRRSRPYDAPCLVVAAAAILILIDGAKVDRYTYRSESEVFGIIVLLLTMPLLGDAVARSRAAVAAPWPRLVPWPLLVALAGWAKASVGHLLALVACYALARTSPRSPVAIGVMGATVVVVLLSLLRSEGALVAWVKPTPLGFLLFPNGAFAPISVAAAYGLAAAAVLTGLRQRRARDPARPGWSLRSAWREPLSWEELVLVMAAAAAVPVLLVSRFETWYFVDAVLWFSLAVVLAGLSRVDLAQLWRSVTSAGCGPVAIGLAVALGAPPVLRAFPIGELVDATREMRLGVEKDAGPAARPDGGTSVRQFFGRSLARHHVLFGPDFGLALQSSYGVRAVELVRRVLDREGRSALGVFVPPQNVRFWRYAVDCRSQPLFLPALAGVPMVRGLPPVAEGCPLPRTYGYADYDVASRAVDAGPGELCRHARGRGLRRVLVLRDVDAPDANTVLRCDGEDGARRLATPPGSRT